MAHSINYLFARHNHPFKSNRNFSSIKSPVGLVRVYDLACSHQPLFLTFESGLLHYVKSILKAEAG